MSGTAIGADAQAIVLVCSRLGLPKDAEAKSLTVREWGKVRERLYEAGERPAYLLDRAVGEISSLLRIQPELAERIARLVSRSGQLAIELERLASRGIWVVTRADPNYPERLKERLGSRCPPVLFGAGAVELMARPGVAVVGSRDPGEDGLEMAVELGRRCAGASATLYSGAARGVDRSAMLGCTDSGGVSVGVVADSLERMIRRREFRQPIVEQRLTLVTPFHPAASFTTGAAMGRNKYIYCLADFAIVAAIGAPSGGTWEGGQENLKQGWVPLYVWSGTADTQGGQALVVKGARPLDWADIPASSGLMAALAKSSGSGVSESQEAIQQTFGAAQDIERPGAGADEVRESASVAVDEAPRPEPASKLFLAIRPVLSTLLTTRCTADDAKKRLGVTKKLAGQWLDEAVAQGIARASGTAKEKLFEEVSPGVIGPSSADADAVFSAVWPLLDEILSGERNVGSVAAELGVCKTDARNWLRQAVRSGRAEFVRGSGAYRKAAATAKADSQINLPL